MSARVPALLIENEEKKKRKRKSLASHKYAWQRKKRRGKRRKQDSTNSGPMSKRRRSLYQIHQKRTQPVCDTEHFQKGKQKKYKNWSSPKEAMTGPVLEGPKIRQVEEESVCRGVRKERKCDNLCNNRSTWSDRNGLRRDLQRGQSEVAILFLLWLTLFAG